MPADQYEASIGEKKGDLHFLALLALIVWLPLPLGSNRPWAWAVAEVWGFGIMAAWLYTFRHRLLDLPPNIKAARLPLFLMILWLFSMVFQAIPLPKQVLEFLSPASWELYSFYSKNKAAEWFPITIDLGATVSEFFKGLFLFCIFFLVLALVDRRDRLKTLAKVIVFVGLGEALYGLLNTLTGMERIWWMEKAYYRGNVTGTFINRNHFAGHMELVIPVGLGLLLAGQPKLRYYVNLRAKIRGMTRLLLDEWGRIAAYIIIMISALFLSASRGGVASLFTSLFIVLCLAMFYRGFHSREGRLFIFSTIMSAAAIIWLGLGVLPRRYNNIDFETFEGRSGVWEPAIAMWSDYPIFGSGAGTFQSLFTIYEEGRLWFYYDHAHNDYLELLTDQGVIGFLLLGGLIVSALFPVATAFIRRRDPLIRGITFASLVGALSALFHATIDFNFHILANAAYFYVLVGMGIIAAEMKRSQPQNLPDHP